MAIQHYVSQFLTKPWERPKTKTLVYYDFEADRVEEAKAKDLFATTDVHPKEIDDRINKLIEDPLARLWHRVREEGVKEATDWREIRAAHLVFLSQPLRVFDHTRASEGSLAAEDRQLDELLGKPDSYLDVLVQSQMRSYDLRIFSTVEGPLPGSDELGRATLFYPQTGLIGFPVLEDSEKKPLATVTGAFGIPVHPQIMLAIVPKSVGAAGLSMIHQTAHAYSVGLTSSCRKVVIPVTVMDRYDPVELGKRIRGLRAHATEMAQLMGQMRQLIERIQSTFGLVP